MLLISNKYKKLQDLIELCGGEIRILNNESCICEKKCRNFIN
ncbi:hypothetical protein FEDK69T_26340 [Flavobacterium enshiense DK69]|nr:hypothetical protein FEDK69T_26340 [Flavobacterium enshiense DK69]